MSWLLDYSAAHQEQLFCKEAVYIFRVVLLHA